MAESQEDLEEHTHQSVIRGHHNHKYIWSPYIGEHLTLQLEDSNIHDRHAVCLMKDNCTVGHVPRELSRVFWYFLCHGGGGGGGVCCTIRSAIVRLVATRYGLCINYIIITYLH